MRDIPPMPGGRSRAPLQCAFETDPHARGRHIRPRQAWTEEALHPDPRLPDERVRLPQDGGSARRRARDAAHPRRGRSGRDPGEHLLDPRKGAGKGVQPTRPLEGVQAGQARRTDRRRRLRGLAGRRGDRRTRTVCRPGVRPPDPASPARSDRRAPRQRPTAGRHLVPRDREVRCAAGTPRGRPERVRVDHGRLQQILLVLRGALHPRHRDFAPVRRRAGGSRDAGRTGRQGGQPARPERQRLPRTDVRRRQRRPGLADPRDRPDRWHRPHPFHHFAPAGVFRLAGGRLPRRAQARELPASAGAVRFRPHPCRDEARLHRAGVQVEDQETARGAPGHLRLQRFHRRFSRRDRHRFRQDHATDRGRRFRPVVLVHLFETSRHTRVQPARRHARFGQARTPGAPAGRDQRARRGDRRGDGRQRATHPGHRPIEEESERADRQDREHAFGQLS